MYFGKAVGVAIATERGRRDFELATLGGRGVRESLVPYCIGVKGKWDLQCGS